MAFQTSLPCLNFSAILSSVCAAIHIAGTNAKGSTAAFLQSILKHSGYRAGLFTSPHLVSFTERIRINDREIPQVRVARLVQKIRPLCRENSLEAITFFEFVTALALVYFAEEEADPVVVEVGMRGRLDATNVLQPIISIITSISLEHQIYHAVEAKKNDQFAPFVMASLMMVKWPYKLAYYFGYKELDGGERVDLYDIQADPEEMNNLYPAQPAIGSAMFDEQKANLAEKNEPYR